MKFRVDYRLSRGLFILALLFSICLCSPYLNKDSYPGDPFQSTIGLYVVFGSFPALLLVLSFLMTRKYAIYKAQLVTHYIFGLLPRCYDLSQVNKIDIVDKDLPIKVGGLLVTITLNSKFYRLRQINIHFKDKHLKVNGNTIHGRDYACFLKEMKRIRP
jgi:hypothetical protein